MRVDNGAHFFTPIFSALFAREPDVLKEDYAKRMLEDPRVNFAISQRGASAGLDHLGVQVDAEAELAQLNERLTAAELSSGEQTGAACLLCPFQ